MDLHPRDLAAAERFARSNLAAFPRLTDEQLRSIRAIATRYRAWFRRHPRLHNTITAALLLGLLAADGLLLLVVPEVLPWSVSTVQGAIAGGLAIGFAHGWLVCSIVTFSVHEGAAHGLLFQGNGRLAKLGNAIGNNACRLFAADPIYYRSSHGAHHRHLGSEQDGSFTHVVHPARLLLSLLPLAPVVSWSDFFPWRPQAHTPSRRLSGVLTVAYLLIYGAAMAILHGWLFTLVALFMVGSWVSFVLDRLRESTEHALMPLDPKNGTRELGLGFWGLLLGGGPWGQPCHLSHHLAPSLPWYQQIALHLQLRRLLTPSQRRAFFVGAVWPALLGRVLNGPR